MSDFGWHFVGKTLRDGRPIPRDGVWLDHDGPIVICRSGLHGSRLPWHALRYAPGDVLCRVEFDGIVDEHDDDKLVARRRRILCRAEFSETLRYFARMQALSVAHLWTPADVVIEYLMTGDERIKYSAYDAALYAAKSAKSAEAAEAAEAAALYAASAAEAAAWDAACDAARSASGDAARAAACDAARVAVWGSAWGAARVAAWGAAIDKAGLEFDSLVYEQFGMGGNDAE